MPASEARIVWGGKVYLATDNTEATLTLLAEVRTAGFPQDETDEIEVTHLNSPDRYKEFIQGLIDAGEFNITLNYVPGSATDLLLTAAKGTGTVRKARIVVPDNSGTGAADWNFTFPAFIKKYAPDEMNPNEAVTATATFRVAGAVEQGAGAAGS
jgi:hypothetical protein